MLSNVDIFQGIASELDISFIETTLSIIIQSCLYVYMKSSDAKASKCHLKCYSKMTIFIKLEYLSSVISLK